MIRSDHAYMYLHTCICIHVFLSQCHQTFSCTTKCLLCFPSCFQPYERVTFFEIWKEPWVCDRVMAWKRRKPTKSLFSLNFVHVWRWLSSLFNSPPRRVFLRVTVHEHFQFLQYTPNSVFPCLVLEPFQFLVLSCGHAKYDSVTR